MPDTTYSHGQPTGASPAIAVLIRARVRRRTLEIAANAGRTSLQVSQVDYEEAKRELIDKPGADMPPARSDSAARGGIGSGS